jgi:hypothetical protein
MTLAGGLVGVLVPGALAIQEAIQDLLLEGGTLSRSICYSDGVLGAMLAVLILGRLRAIVVLVGLVSWRSAIMALVIVLSLLRAVVGVAPVFVVAVSFFNILHFGMLVEDRHHLRDLLRVALEHLAPELDTVQPLVEVVNDVPIINLCNRVTISEVPLGVVAQGSVRPLGDAA